MTDSGADSGTTTGRRFDNYSSLENDSNDDSLNHEGDSNRKQEIVVPAGVIPNFQSKPESTGAIMTANLSLTTRFESPQEYMDDSDILAIQESLRAYLNLHLNPSYKLRPELNMYQKYRPIVHTEQELIEECLMLLSGLKSNLLFKQSPNGSAEFIVNSKYRLVYLHKELEECLCKVAYYATSVVRIERFMAEQASSYDESTQVYEAFIECLVEYMKYFKTTLHEISTLVVKKEKKFTLVDFLSHVRTSYFVYLDLLVEFLGQIERDRAKHASEKSVNLLVCIHRHLISRCYSSRNWSDRVARFLLWLFVRSLAPYLHLIDGFIHEGVLLDSRAELGFKRNPSVSISHLDYLKSGFDLLMPKSTTQLPSFIRIILSSSFKICKYMEVVKLLENINRDADVYDTFLERIRSLCPILIAKHERIPTPETSVISTNSKTLLDINFSLLKNEVIKHNRDDKLKWSVNKVAEILEANDAKDIDFNLETELEGILADSYMKYVNYSSSVLIVNLLDRFNLRKFFVFLQAYYLFKGNEIMFLFSKSLFDLVKRLESYQDDGILNKLLFHSVNTVFTTDSLAKNTVFNAANLVTIHYDRSMDEKHQALMHKIRNVDGMTRLIGGIRVRVKINWPLNVVISQPNLDVYNRLFVFMMQLKQAKYDLDSLRLQDMDLDRVKIKPTPNELDQIDPGSVKKMLYLRFKLMNFMNNAHDLICNQIYEITEEFTQRLEQKRDIDEIVELHEKFLVKLTKSCLLGVNAIQNSFLRIFALVLEFCDVWRRGIAFFTFKNQLYVDEVDKNIKENFSFAYVLLGQISNKAHSTYLQLLVSVLE